MQTTRVHINHKWAWRLSACALAAATVTACGSRADDDTTTVVASPVAAEAGSAGASADALDQRAQHNRTVSAVASADALDQRARHNRTVTPASADALDQRAHYGSHDASTPTPSSARQWPTG